MSEFLFLLCMMMMPEIEIGLMPIEDDLFQETPEEPEEYEDDPHNSEVEWSDDSSVSTVDSWQEIEEVEDK